MALSSTTNIRLLTEENIESLRIRGYISHQTYSSNNGFDVDEYVEEIQKNGFNLRSVTMTFDDFNNDSRVKFDLKQQLYGPFILGLQANYNINTDSSEYGSFQNKNISIELSRRAYSLGLTYSDDDNSIFFGFNIFNFPSSKLNSEF